MLLQALPRLFIFLILVTFSQSMAMGEFGVRLLAKNSHTRMRLLSTASLPFSLSFANSAYEPFAAYDSDASPVGGVAEIDKMKLQRLYKEHDRLEESKPGLATPIVLLCLSVPVAAAGAVLVWFGFAGGSIALIAVGALLALTGVTFLVTGTILLIVRIISRIAIAVKLNSIDTQIEETENRARNIHNSLKLAPSTGLAIRF